MIKQAIGVKSFKSIYTISTFTINAYEFKFAWYFNDKWILQVWAVSEILVILLKITMVVKSYWQHIKYNYLYNIIRLSTGNYIKFIALARTL